MTDKAKRDAEAIAAIRAPLFVPASRADRFAKAAASGADAVILDLEDAVGPGEKEAARAQLACDFTDLPVLVRVNAHGTPWHAADIAAVRALPVSAVVLPKSEDAGEVRSVVDALGGSVPLVALVETAQGLASARAIAAIGGVVRLAFGSVDYCADLGCDHLREVLLPARSELVLASRLARIAAPIDGVTTALDDASLTEADAAHARNLGMSGKLCIHPRQIEAVKRAFAPGKAEIVWAERVLAAGEGAVAVDGAMVDEPVRIRARAILSAVR
ncbi:citrate lyase subunit beta/citryl-CoA lyase [Breoghania corrubedonensis]|uniref:Citrate lyase subunit beta/citryl-CoA lyase n=1 Tax=Breoghania corrubedonensis TaxID=665038 RepID=A0A2T5V5K0_9HYPH|nr:CoA ester lyase [Breoghania corrubedonensis]PTW59024.1 citrate lyase subunit beta/citryl-CoA lyase [Breoghania corrubedonensis]